MPGRRRSPWLLVTVLGIGIFIAGFDQTLIVTILPDILDGLRIPVDRFGDASWMVSGYLVGYTVAMPIMGRIADVYGHIRLYIIAFLIFMLGSVLVAVSPNLTWFVLARGFQAIGGGAVVPIGLAIAADVLPLQRRPLGLAILTGLDDTSSLLGPLWGAALVGITGWQGLFWLNLILALPLLIAVPRMAPRDNQPSKRTVDWVGGGLLTAALVMSTFAITDNGSSPRPAAVSLALGLAGLALIVAFVLHERKSAHPMIDVRMFTMPRYVAANATFFIVGAGLITCMVTVPLMSNVLWEATPLEGGLNLMRMLLFMPVGALLGGVLAIVLGYRGTALLGLAGAAAGLFWMREWSAAPSNAALWGALALVGLGFTLVAAPVMATVLDAVAESQRAAAAAFLQVFQTMGMIVGMALLATQGLGRFSQQAAALFAERGLEVTVEEYQAVLRQTFSETFLVAGCAVLVAVVFALFLEPGRARRWRGMRLFGL
jgi:MFS family permease